MKLKVFYDRENSEKYVDLGNSATVKDLLKEMGINSVTVIVSKNNTVVTEDEKINEKDDIKILSVISGG